MPLDLVRDADLERDLAFISFLDSDLDRDLELDFDLEKDRLRCLNLSERGR